MIDSLLGLIAGLAVAALPLLVTILRFRRRRRGARATTTDRSGAYGTIGAAPGVQSASGADAQAWPDIGTSAAGAAAPPADTRTAPAAGRTHPAAGETTTAAGREAQHAAGQDGQARFPESLNRYPPLQRAILLQEILGPPKGLG